LIIILTINFSLALYSDLFKKIPSDNIKILYAGCYTQNINGFLIKDNESNKVDKLFEYEFNYASKLHYTFKSNINGIQKVKFPDFLMAFTKIDRIKELTFRKLDLNRIYCSIYFIRNQDNSKIDVRVNFNNTIFMDNEFHDRFSYLFTSISKDENINSENLIRSVCNFYVAIAGQSVLQAFIDQKQFLPSTRVLIDSENMIVSASNFLTQYGNESTKKKINDLRDYWLADLERYKGLLYQKQDHPISAINHYFNSLYYDFYYPHETYEEMKYRLLTDYDGASDTLNYYQSINPLFPTMQHIINLIIDKGDSAIVAVTIQRLNQLRLKFQDNPLYWFYYGEIIKYCYIDGKKYNLIFEKRIDDSISAFQKVIEMDPTFSLVYTKIGALKFILSDLTNDPTISEKLKKEGRLYADKDLTLFYLQLEK